MHIYISLELLIPLCLIFSGNKDTEADSHSSKENSETFSRVFYQSQIREVFWVIFLSISFYYISRLLRAPWLVNWAGRILLYGPLKLKLLLSPKRFVIHSHVFLILMVRESLILPVTLLHAKIPYIVWY